MNCFLLDKIESVEEGILATILSTEGHTYKKRGAKALYTAGDPIPLHGNLGSLCVDQDIAREGAQAWREGRPRVIGVDTSSEEDAELGYGTYCGGKIELLLEPVGDAQREVYRRLRSHLTGGDTVWLVHDLATGQLIVERSVIADENGIFVEPVLPLRPLYVFGATPLAAALVRVLHDSRFDIHVIDWRRELLERMQGTPGVSLHEDDYPLDGRSAVVLLSHSFHRDKVALRRAIDAGAAWIGMLSSRRRRDRMYEELRAEGVDAGELERVSSPAGIDIGAVTDTGIAVSIAAELIGGVRTW